ncbi:MAG: M20 family metallopeptidase [bacterium]
MRRPPGIDEAFARRLTAWRRHLHMHPELSGEESGTARWVTEQLTREGIAWRDGFAGHAVAARIEADRPGPTVLLRADMDALPIQEAGPVPYASTRPGVMHACGHDAHTACLLGALELLAAGRTELPRGRVIGLFQPSEEAPPSGAKAVADSGLLEEEEVAAAAALHIDHTLPVGTLGIRPGAMMARCDEFEVTFTGPGGHTSAPEGVPDPLGAAARLASALQRTAAETGAGLELEGPDGEMVCRAGILRSGTAANVIPDRALLRGTARTFHPRAAASLQQAVERAAARTAEGAGVEIEWVPGGPPVRNDPALTDLCRRAWLAGLGGTGVRELSAPSPAGEDFGHLMTGRPGLFWRLGIRGPERGGVPWHTDRFDLDEDALPVGAWSLAAAAAALVEAF